MPSGGGRNPVTNRLLRHFNFIAYPTIDHENMNRIFTSILNAFLKNDFASEVQEMSTLMVQSAIETYDIIMQVWCGSRCAVCGGVPCAVRALCEKFSTTGSLVSSED